LRSIGEVGWEIRESRMGAGLTCAQVGAACGISASYEARIERGEARRVSVVLLALLCAAVGLDLSVRAFPAGTPLRDSAHLALLARVRASLHPGWTWRSEVPIPLPGDPRSWDAVIDRDGLRIGVEAETRVRDIQALDRRIALKLRDSGLDHVILVLADTRSNRAVLRAFADDLRANHPIPPRVAKAALASGEDPGGSAVLLL
jgi:transcriptional regulator with XRE-family HTH domain